MIERTCQWHRCKKKFMAKPADVKRGWATFCSKSCKAKEQESRTFQNAEHRERIERAEENGETFSDAHLCSNEDHDCNKGER